MLTSAFVPGRLDGLTTREAITDAFYRLMDSFDENSADLLRSAVTLDVVLIAHGRETTGFEAVAQTALARAGPLDTTHMVTDMRVDVVSDATVKLTAKCLAQHYPTGTGATSATQRLLGATKNFVELVKDETNGLWRARRWQMIIVWREGDMSIVQPES